MPRSRSDNVSFDIIDYSDAEYTFKREYTPKKRNFKPIMMVVSREEYDRLLKIKEERKVMIKKIVEEKNQDKKSSSLEKMKEKIKKNMYKKKISNKKYNNIENGYKNIFGEMEMKPMKPMSIQDYIDNDKKDNNSKYINPFMEPKPGINDIVKPFDPNPNFNNNSLSKLFENPWKMSKEEQEFNNFLKPKPDYNNFLEPEELENPDDFFKKVWDNSVNKYKKK